MRHLERLPKPNILTRKENEWTEKFIASGNKRPDNGKYGHKDIVADLNAISFHKCFYSEQKLKGIPKEIDHHIEVSERKDLAYDWDNLYLSSTICNNKLPNKTISVNNALNPFTNSDEEIEEHLTFEDECITAKNSSKLGFDTIKKYRLNSELLDSLRGKQLIMFYKVLDIVRQNQVKEQRDVFSEDEKEALCRFVQPDYSFSLMFRLLLKKHNL
jgi:hypothetical protein